MSQSDRRGGGGIGVRIEISLTSEVMMYKFLTNITGDESTTEKTVDT